MSQKEDTKREKGFMEHMDSGSRVGGFMFAWVVAFILFVIFMLIYTVILNYNEIENEDILYGGTGEVVKLTNNVEVKELDIQGIRVKDKSVDIQSKGESITIPRESYDEFKPEVGDTVGYKPLEYKDRQLIKDYMSQSAMQLEYLDLP